MSLSGEGYLAVTTNTLQFGVEFTATISSGSWNIQGKLGGDALVRMPFFFDISIHGSVAVRYKSHTLAAVKLKGGLRGPRPLVLYGEVCIELLFFDVCFSDSWELSSSDLAEGGPRRQPRAGAGRRTGRGRNLTMADSADALVHVAVRDVGEGPVFGPLGTLLWAQQRVPLDFTVAMFEGNPLAAPQRVTISASVASGVLPDWFSPGQFLALSEAEALALPSFERHQSGLAVSMAETRSAPVAVEVDVEEIRIPSPPRRGGVVTFPGGVLDRLAGRDTPVTEPGGPPRFTVRDDLFSIGALAPGELLSAVEAHTRVTLAGAVDGTVAPVQHRGGPSGRAGGSVTLQLQFFGWWRPAVAGLVSSGQLADGRLQGSLTLTATATPPTPVTPLPARSPTGCRGRATSPASPPPPWCAPTRPAAP